MLLLGRSPRLVAILFPLRLGQVVGFLVYVANLPVLRLSEAANEVLI